MRVIGGSLRGRRLRAPRGLETRPTSGRAREALFGALAPELEGACVLDLFCGSGALGIEALSRGATRAEFVDASRAAIAALRGNLADLGVAERARVRQQDVRRSVLALARSGRRFDLILADPPYEDAAMARWLARAPLGALLARGGRLVVERRRDLAPIAVPPGLRHLATREYGKTAFDHYVAAVASRADPTARPKQPPDPDTPRLDTVGDVDLRPEVDMPARGDTGALQERPGEERPGEERPGEERAPEGREREDPPGGAARGADARRGANPGGDGDTDVDTLGDPGDAGAG